ncbi:hypothetical protein [Ammoniphilus resinae]|uniref:IrrE N-terminal-like domain-containing protein n=1 Tax=Ammoniphilus resinae TaxID=861532 RepID=A0ABS4GYA3_9BACL|nr:hypothetical protein [Ammoniphilus resinae]MBP1935017.1 hypothetical protein [Ammoniphilus resinae]
MSVLEKAENFLRNFGIDIPVVEMTQIDLGVARYDCLNNKFEINLHIIEFEAEKMEMSLNDYIKILMCHEIGHYLDNNVVDRTNMYLQFLEDVKKGNHSYQAEYDMSQVICDSEIIAWENGRKFVPEELLEKYEEMNIKNYDSAKFRIHFNVLQYKHISEKEKLLKDLVKLQNNIVGKDIEIDNLQFELARERLKQI